MNIKEIMLFIVLDIIYSLLMVYVFKIGFNFWIGILGGFIIGLFVKSLKLANTQ